MQDVVNASTMKTQRYFQALIIMSAPFRQNHNYGNNDKIKTPLYCCKDVNFFQQCQIFSSNEL